MNPDLADRLVEAGVNPSRITNPEEAWLRLHDRFGLRATLIDRYALESESRGIAPENLPKRERRRIAQEVLKVRYPGIELVGLEGGDPVDIVPYDNRWPALFATWREHLTAALGPIAIRIEHMGSTAVPGLAAKPVIDVQVSVSNVENEGAYVPGIESLGVPLRMREPGHRYFRPPPEQPRIVQFHACDAGGQWERNHLLFRDYLRADSETRNAYAALKLGLAERHRDDRPSYNEAKTEFILDTLNTAHLWADRTGWTVAQAETQT